MWLNSGVEAFGLGMLGLLKPPIFPSHPDVFLCEGSWDFVSTYHWPFTPT